MEGKHIAECRAEQRERPLLLGGSGKGIIVVSGHEAAIRLWSRARGAKSPTAQAQFLRTIPGKYSRASHRQRQAAAKLTTFMSGIRRFMNSYAILWQKLYACFSENTFNQGKRVLVSSVATHLDIRDRVLMKTGRLSQVQNRPIQCSTRPSELVHLPQARIANVTCDKVRTVIAVSPNQGGIQ